ncbi:hypothetical protein GB931_19840 [Modestobacter sp. I12A-02628]|uniref:Uncharacterized protein n=1 Tax=Goekera deserti TaxID=2497753 RepID=A0A7K3WFL4_9ACTN|nr:hypothetical protein [Goekera deserti]MPR00127.1 hypothetical protein [Goekera deserti]NDI49906.1 hypothetical protein [Goekera deserti]NEL55268.1 hypothetical protein [Goekera deserti]
MSSPRDRDGFDGPDGQGWREPEHLGGGSTPAGRPGQDPAGATPGPTPDAGPPAAWEPPGWSLPAAEPERPVRPADPSAGAPPPAEPRRQWGPTPDQIAGRQPGQVAGGGPEPVQQPEQQWAPQQPWGSAAEQPWAPGQQQPGEQPGQEQGGQRGFWGAARPARRRADRVGDQVFRYQGDLVGAQGWGMDNGWVPSDGTGPEDAVLAQLVAASPVRPSKDDRPGNVLRGRLGSLELVAFDVVYTSGRYAQPRWAVTAAPVLGELPSFRLSPARFWKHRTGGLLHLPSGDPEFDTRWVLLAPEDTPQLRRLVDDVVVRQLLLGSDDGDELWSAAGHVAAIRPDGHRPELIQHQGRILTAVVGALAALR